MCEGYEAFGGLIISRGSDNLVHSHPPPEALIPKPHTKTVVGFENVSQYMCYTESCPGVRYAAEQQWFKARAEWLASVKVVSMRVNTPEEIRHQRGASPFHHVKPRTAIKKSPILSARFLG